MRLKEDVWQLIRMISVSARIGFCVGFAVGLIVLLYGDRMSGYLVIFLCPTSMVGMGLDNAPVVLAVGMGVSMILVGNAIWYAIVFGFGWMLWKNS